MSLKSSFLFFLVLLYACGYDIVPYKAAVEDDEETTKIESCTVNTNQYKILESTHTVNTVSINISQGVEDPLSVRVYSTRATKYGIAYKLELDSEVPTLTNRNALWGFYREDRQLFIIGIDFFTDLLKEITTVKVVLTFYGHEKEELVVCQTSNRAVPLAKYLNVEGSYTKLIEFQEAYVMTQKLLDKCSASKAKCLRQLKEKSTYSSWFLISNGFLITLGVIIIYKMGQW